MSKKENKELAKRKRLEERKAKEQKALMTKVGIGCAVVVVVGAIIGGAAYSSRKPAEQAASTEQTQASGSSTDQTAEQASTDSTVDITDSGTSSAGELDTTEGVEIKEGDTVAIDFVGKEDGVAFEGGSGSYNLTIGSGSFIEGFEDGLIGKKVGETVDLNLTFPEDYGNPAHAGKDVVFTVTINGIYK